MCRVLAGWPHLTTKCLNLTSVQNLMEQRYLLLQNKNILLTYRFATDMQKEKSNH